MACTCQAGEAEKQQANRGTCIRRCDGRRIDDLYRVLIEELVRSRTRSRHNPVSPEVQSVRFFTVVNSFRAGPTFEILASNTFNDPCAPYCLASVAVSQGQLFIKTDANMWVVGERRK